MENKKTLSITLWQLNAFDYGSKILLLYWIAYNSYFGFNSIPISVAEIELDRAFKVGCGMLIGVIISASVSFMRLVVNYIKSKTE